MLTPLDGFWFFAGDSTAKARVMAGKIKPMSQIKQLLLLYEQGKGFKTISRTLGMSKNTVKSYISKLDGLTQGKKGSSLQELLSLEDPELQTRFHSGNPSYKDSRYPDFIARKDYFLSELQRVGVTRRLLWQEYREHHPQGYSYTQFCFHLQQHRIAMRSPTMVLSHTPGEQLFIDFAGKKLSYVDRSTGELVYCPVFVACMPYSDYGFAQAVPSQSTEAFLHALSCCLSALGGVPQALVPDNLKSAVVKASRYEPSLNRALEDFANHYRTTVLPARVAKPRDKALVENQVRLIYQRVYAPLRNAQFFDLQSLNTAIADKMRCHNQTRMQQKPYCREERFLAREKNLLEPLPKQAFELKHYRELKVAQNNHIYLGIDKHYYSVPYRLIGQKVQVVFTHRMVYCYSKGQQVAVHPRNLRRSGYTTRAEHLCSHHQQYRQRSPDYYIERARSRSKVLTQLMVQLFAQNRYPEQLYRSCDGLLKLARHYPKERLERACQIAIDHQQYTYGFVRRILENRLDGHSAKAPSQPLPEHTNLRGKHYYQQLTLNLENL